MATLPLAAIRADLSRVVDDAVRTHERFEITRNGTRAAVLLSAEDFDGITETLDLLSDAAAVADIRVALDEAKRGDVYSTQDVLDGMRAAGRRTP